MTEEDILKIVEKTFDEEISSSVGYSPEGIYSVIEGRETFFKKLSEKLKILFEENDLSK